MMAAGGAPTHSPASAGLASFAAASFAAASSELTIVASATVIGAPSFGLALASFDAGAFAE
jgi:hypothetical protein